MTATRARLVTVAITIAVSMAACETDDSAVTCDNYDHFLLRCTPDCSPLWSCERNYDRLSLFNRDRLDACSDCLVDNLSFGVCADCALPTLGIGSCHLFMEDLLGVACW